MTGTIQHDWKWDHAEKVATWAEIARACAAVAYAGGVCAVLLGAAVAVGACQYAIGRR